MTLPRWQEPFFLSKLQSTGSKHCYLGIAAKQDALCSRVETPSEGPCLGWVSSDFLSPTPSVGVCIHDSHPALFIVTAEKRKLLGHQWSHPSVGISSKRDGWCPTFMGSGEPALCCTICWMVSAQPSTLVITLCLPSSPTWLANIQKQLPKICTQFSLNTALVCSTIPVRQSPGWHRSTRVGSKGKWC